MSLNLNVLAFFGHACGAGSSRCFLVCRIFHTSVHPSCLIHHTFMQLLGREAAAGEHCSQGAYAWCRLQQVGQQWSGIPHIKAAVAKVRS